MGRTTLYTKKKFPDSKRSSKIIK